MFALKNKTKGRQNLLGESTFDCSFLIPTKQFAVQLKDSHHKTIKFNYSACIFKRSLPIFIVRNVESWCRCQSIQHRC